MKSPNISTTSFSLHLAILSSIRYLLPASKDGFYLLRFFNYLTLYGIFTQPHSGGTYLYRVYLFRHTALAQGVGYAPLLDRPEIACFYYTTPCISPEGDYIFNSLSISLYIISYFLRKVKLSAPVHINSKLCTLVLFYFLSYLHNSF